MSTSSSSRNREWLRSFLQLGARAAKDGIPATDVQRQEDTVLRALEMLDDRPGIVLADEVGMGKTYEALGVAAAFRHATPNSRVVVVTPGPDLNHKWFSEFARFKEMFDFGDEVEAVNRLPDFVQQVRSKPIVVAPVTMFQSGKGSSAQAYLLSLFFYWKQLHGKTGNAIMARFKDGALERLDVRYEKFLDVFDLAQVEPHLAEAFHRGDAPGFPGLDDLYTAEGLAGFENDWAVKRALYRARFFLTGRLIPEIDLLIVDEAHKLKNPGSLRTQAMRSVFDGGFRKALFLTATPFQLDVAELREVFELFSGAKTAPPDLNDRVAGLLTSVGEYQHLYDDFQRTWSALDPAVAARFARLYDEDPSALDASEDPTLQLVAKQIAALRKLKNDTIEPGFRHWMIRSRRDEKRVYRQHEKKSIRPNGPGALPFLIYERFIAELFRRGRQTHKAAVEVNMVSSYGAAREGAIMATEEKLPPEAEVYRGLLRTLLTEFDDSANGHPKVADAVADALEAADLGEKTLIFCTRVATLKQLRRELDDAWIKQLLDRWRLVYPDSELDDIFDFRDIDTTRHRGRHSALQNRFHAERDRLYLALREPYLRTLANIADWSLAHLGEIIDEANAILLSIRVIQSAAENLNYQIAKRCVEQAAVRIWSKTQEAPTTHPEWMSSIMNPGYVSLGLDLEKDKYESYPTGDHVPAWKISEETARAVIGPPGSLWEHFSALIVDLPRDQRVRLIEQLARYLTYKEVPFLADLLLEAKPSVVSLDPIKSEDLFGFMPSFWETPRGEYWLCALRDFLTYFLQRTVAQQSEILDGPIKTVRFARHTQDGESRERLREAFNTPLYPMVLIANEVMQEGLDLHKHCRRVIHHDLTWNPAQIEQRIGRIDRLGSLTNRLRKEGQDAKLDVFYPVIHGTIDDRLYRTVKTREKWLEFLLGAPPSFSEYTFSDEIPPPLPTRLASDLAINLGPT